MSATYLRHLRPAFLIIGANKGATSSLYRYLVEHPAVLPCAEKEPNFFGLHTPEQIAAHIDDYFALFPSCDGTAPVELEWEDAPVVVERAAGGEYITGAATASTCH